MLSPFMMAVSKAPDLMLASFTDNGRFEVAKWLRTEHLTQDFAELLGVYSADVSAVPGNIGQVNAKEYDHNLMHWFTEEHVGLMYETNPIWASIEDAVYGGRLMYSSHSSGSSESC